MKFASLFSGIGGFERGLASEKHELQLLCEIMPAAQRILRTHYDAAELHSDVRDLQDLPGDVELLTAGFPCQDLSQAGTTQGMAGARSGLITEVVRLASKARPAWIVLENVSFMLHLRRGEAMKWIADQLELLGYRWAWRVVDTYAFGLPQRRLRVFVVASLQGDPASVLLGDDAPIARPSTSIGSKAHGFYWTEGRTGLGWAPDAIPTLKNGSAVGIPSPPAILMPDGAIVKPDISDAERLQGFPADWTLPATEVGRASARWSLVGSAVSVPVAGWLGSRLNTPGEFDRSRLLPLDETASLPNAAYFDGRTRWKVQISTDPKGLVPPPLASFLNSPGQPLSHRAASSFLARTRLSTLRFDPGFIRAVEAYVQGFEVQDAAEAA